MKTNQVTWRYLLCLMMVMVVLALMTMTTTCHAFQSVIARRPTPTTSQVPKYNIHHQRSPAFKFYHGEATATATATVTATTLFLSSSDSSTPSSKQQQPQDNNNREQPQKLDVDALTKYAVALAVQVSLIFGFFKLLDSVVAACTTTGFGSDSIPFSFWINFALFYAMSIKSRIFNPLSNKRPQVSNLEVTTTVQQTEGASVAAPAKRNMPSWTPPGVVFPIMWLLIIAPIRAYTTAMIYHVTKIYAHPAIMAFILHLSIGDVWNTINNVERRYGTSVTGVLCVWLSKANAAYQYAQVSPLAGQIMALPLLWLTVAAALVTRTWQLNPNAETGKVEPLYPVVGSTKTQFEWSPQKLKNN